MNNTGIKLSGDTSAWNEEIIGHLAERSTKLVSNIMTSIIMKSDYSKGDVTGYIVLNGHKGYIPLIIRSFRLKPLDIILSDGKFQVINDRVVDQALFDSKISRKSYRDPKDVITNTDITNITIPPATSISGLGSLTKRVNTKAGSVTNFIALGAIKCASAEVKKEVMDTLQEDMSLLKKVAELLPVKDVINSLSLVDGVSLEAADPPPSNTDLYPMYINEYAANKFRVNIPHHTLTEEGTENLSRLLNDSQKSSLLSEKEVLIHDPNETDVHSDIDIIGDNKYTELGDYGVCTAHCVDITGELHYGTMLPSVEQFEGVLTGQGLFIGETEHDWTYSECVPGIPQDVQIKLDEQKLRGANSNLQNKMRERAHEVNTSIDIVCNHILKEKAVPGLGDYGCFVSKDSYCFSRVLEPFYISAVYKVSGGYIMAVVTQSGQRLGLQYAKNENTCGASLEELKPVFLQKYFEVHNAYKVGGGFKYIRLGNKLNSPRSIQEANTLTYRTMDFGRLVSINKDHSGSYVLKRASSTSDFISKTECEFQLVSKFGLAPKQAAELIQRAPVKYIEKDAYCVEKKAYDEMTEGGTKAAYAALLRNESSENSVMDGPDTGRQVDVKRGRPSGSKNKINKKMLSATGGIGDAKLMDMILSLSISGSDASVKNYMASYLDDIHEAIDKLARTVLFARMNNSTELSDDSLTFLLSSLSDAALNIKDFVKSKQRALRDKNI